MLDAKQILQLMQDYWSLSNPSLTSGYNAVINSKFEQNLIGWTTILGSPAIDTNDYYSASKSCLLHPEDEIKQSVTWNIPVSSIIKFGFWAKGINWYSELGLPYVLFTDDTKWYYTIGPYDDWTYRDLLTALKIDCPDKTVKNIIISNHGSGNGWIDDVTLEYGVVGELYLALDEFNPNYPKYQLVFINRPARTIFLSPNVFKVEQDIQIELHTKLIRYDPDTVSSIRDIFTNIKAEVKRILNVYRFDEVGSTLNMNGWVDSKLPHGYGLDKEPLELISRLNLQIIFYNAEDATLIGTRVHKVTIIDNDLLGLIDATWIDTNPWVRIEIPKGPIIEQNLIGPHIQGEISTHDYNSINTCLYETEITENPNHYPINSDNSKTKFSTDIPSNPELVITMKDNEGIEYIYNFYNVRIQTIELEKTPTSGLKEGIWKIRFMADYLYYGAVQ